MTKDDDRVKEEFTSEAEELLDALSNDLVEFESQGRNVRPELVNKIFREIHSLKGLAGMLGFVQISELSHNLEDMLDKLRMGKVEISRDLLDLLYDSVDSLNRLVIAIHDPSMEALVDVPKLSSRIHALVSQKAPEQKGDPLAGLEIDEQTKKSLTEYEEHRLVENVKSGRAIFLVEVTFDFSDFDEKLRAITAVLSELGEVISTLPAMDSSGGSGISFRLLYGSDAGEAAVVEMAGREAKVRSLRTGVQAPAVPDDAIAAEPGAEEDFTLRSMSRTVRVDIGKLDHVMNIVGELIIEKNHLEGVTRTLQNQRIVSHELVKISRNFDRKLNELQKSVIETRMVPIGQIYSKLGRTVRKVARELRKEIDLVLRGEDTELDKMMVEQLTDPLMHIIRNAIDHGIETAEQRTASGKSATARVVLNAYQKGNSVVIDVIDDGRGIDPEKVKQVAVKRGLVGPKETIDLARACELLFTPGFSTAAEVSEISGRGVGLDVVRKNLQELKGSIDIISDIGKGSTFRIMLPITLAIIQALVVRAGDENFAIPLTSVEESLRIRAKEITTVERREVFSLRNFALPLLRLSDAFQVKDGRDTSSPDTKWFVVVTRAGERMVGILVDALVRQQEIVIKSIGDRLKAIPGIAGATEIGENEIILVVDVGSLIDNYGPTARMIRSGR
ncbi:MAG: chemotaxis protein CheA [Thermoanaerobaculia bacterium]|jgi:two-component system chemotaxis sensor kinase CheA